MPPNKNSGFLAKTQQDENGRETLVSVQIPEDADVIVIQRPAHPLQPQMVNILRSNGVAVVIDMDDDMSTIHPQNSAYHIYRHHSASPLSWRYAELCCKMATAVTVSTPQLLKVYASHGRGRVINNFVPEYYLDQPKIPTQAFGWAGTTGSHPNDPQVTAPAAQRLISERHMFQVVGGDRKVQGAFRLKEPPAMTGMIPMRDWIHTIGSSMDVGWAPLAQTSFNSSKSRLKALEYMSAGVPWIGSPRAEYRALHKDSGCGFLAETPKHWYEHTKRLLGDDSLRQEQIEAGKAYLKTQTYEQNAWRWWEVWEEASKLERQRVGLS